VTPLSGGINDECQSRINWEVLVRVYRNKLLCICELFKHHHQILFVNSIELNKKSNRN
jgi:hypothetical protein